MNGSETLVGSSQFWFSRFIDDEVIRVMPIHLKQEFDTVSIYEAIKQDHEIQRDLLDQLIATSGDTEERTAIFQRLKAELADHADCEERYYYVPLIKLDTTQDDARHGIAEHHEIDELVEKLDETEQDSPGWLQHAKNLAHKVRHHLDEEEQDYFPVSKKVLSGDRESNLGEEYVAAMKQARNKR